MLPSLPCDLFARGAMIVREARAEPRRAITIQNAINLRDGDAERAGRRRKQRPAAPNWAGGSIAGRATFMLQSQPPRKDGGSAVAFCGPDSGIGAERTRNSVLAKSKEHSMTSSNHPPPASLNKDVAIESAGGAGAPQQQEVLFNQFVSAIADYAIFMLDVEGHVLTWNKGAERIKGYTADEIIGKSLGVFYTPEDRAAGIHKEALRTAAATGKFEAESWRVRKDGTRFYANVVLDALRDDDGKLFGFAKITRDMTERRALEEQLAQSQKLEAVGLLTGGVAHDFNNLLTVIVGNLDIIALASSSPERRSRCIELAKRSAQRAATLTQQLLAFSRRQPLNPKPEDINRLVAGATELLRPVLGESIALETVLSGGLWLSDVDANQLESALVNLALNARDAMPNGGKLTIETANAHLDEMYRSQGNLDVALGQYVQICVTDTGVGMAKDVLQHAFEPFYTTKPIGQGTGLGLSQVYGFVRQSGGNVKIYSEVGQGTTVKIYLPRIASSKAPKVELEPQPSMVGGHETILLVEDDRDVREFAGDTLRELGFNVIEASDGTRALDFLTRNPNIDLLFTDVGLPGINGRQLAERAVELRPGLPVLFTTGYARNAIVHQGRLDEGVELLTKPYTREQMAARIREILDRHQPFSK
ncbi:MAG: ATP-binding protein [Rhodanobacteraceae bacterium]